jgi:hypothetical protein
MRTVVVVHLPPIRDDRHCSVHTRHLPSVHRRSGMRSWMCCVCGVSGVLMCGMCG